MHLLQAIATHANYEIIIANIWAGSAAVSSTGAGEDIMRTSRPLQICLPSGLDLLFQAEAMMARMLAPLHQ
jgi:isoaspartyl peptidase/L-asparaginase-like protein (Ntn-hydrolase superfamily)